MWRTQTGDMYIMLSNNSTFMWNAVKASYVVDNKEHTRTRIDDPAEACNWIQSPRLGNTNHIT